MVYGNKGISVSVILLVVVVIAAAIFVVQGNYNIPKPPIEAKAPVPDATGDVFQQETASSANNDTVVVETTQTDVQTETANATENATQSTVVAVEEVKPTITTDHVVISEVKIAGNEFVELYNPTSSDVSMDGWWIGYYPPFSNWGEPKVYTPLKLGSTIKSHGFFLIGGRGYATGANSQLSADNTKVILGEFGSIALFNVDIRGMTLDNIKSKKVDVIGWGVSEYVVEGKPIKFDDYTNQALSIERKPGQLDPSNGNYEDTENNANDFLIKDTPEPQTTSSSIEP